MSHLGSNYPIESVVCEKCGTDQNLSKHHVKDEISFIESGEIKILCRDCHNKEERILEAKGLLGKRFTQRILKKTVQTRGKTTQQSRSVNDK